MFLLAEAAVGLISITEVVKIVLLLLGCGAIVALLWWLTVVCGVPEPWRHAIKVILAVFSVLLLIGLILSFITGTPLFRP